MPVPVIVGGCASYQTALHLMRTGAAGVLVGVGPGAACTTRGVLGVGVPQATAIADAAAARIAAPARDRAVRQRDRRRRHAHRRRHRQGDRLRRRRGDGRLAAGPGHEAPGRGYHWGMATFHPTLPRGARVKTEQVGDARGDRARPGHENDGTLNLMGALRTSMATTGYETIHEFQKAEIMFAPALQTEGKKLQKEQGVGMSR